MSAPSVLIVGCGDVGQRAAQVLASTDELYFASGYLDCPGAMFTASHNPAEYNGIKLCRAGAAPVGSGRAASQACALEAIA